MRARGSIKQRQDKVPLELALDIGQRRNDPSREAVSRNDMSIDIATALRGEASKAREVAARVSSADDRKALTQLSAKLVEIAERLERDARD